MAQGELDCTFPYDPVSDRLGITYARIADRACLARLDAGPVHCNVFGVVHGAVLFAMADTAMGYALLNALGGQLRLGSISVTANYLSPVPPGRVSARAALVRQGRSVAFLGCDIADAAGNVAACFSGIFHIRPADKDRQP